MWKYPGQVLLEAFSSAAEVLKLRVQLAHVGPPVNPGRGFLAASLWGFAGRSQNIGRISSRLICLSFYEAFTTFSHGFRMFQTSFSHIFSVKMTINWQAHLAHVEANPGNDRYDEREWLKGTWGRTARVRAFRLRTCPRASCACRSCCFCLEKSTYAKFPVYNWENFRSKQLEEIQRAMFDCRRVESLTGENHLAILVNCRSHLEKCFRFVEAPQLYTSPWQTTDNEISHIYYPCKFTEGVSPSWSLKKT